MRLATLLIPLLALLTLGGCQSARIEWSSWATHRGGILTDEHQTRADAVAQRLVASTIDRPLHVHVMATSELGAYCFASGDILITRGLMDQITDEQLAAAIAHELGHLLADGNIRSVVGLAGEGASPDAEARADAIACQFLATQQLGHAPLISLLQILLGKYPASAESIALRRRITLLKANS